MSNHVSRALIACLSLAALMLVSLSGCGSSGTSTTPGSPSVFYSTAVFFNGSTSRAAGYNGFGQLGDGTVNARKVFTKMTLPSTYRGIVAGGYHTLAFSTYSAWTAGGNSDGQLGRSLKGDLQDERYALVSGLPRGVISGAAAGGKHSLLIVDGRILAFGANDQGQLGNSGTAGSTIPVEVLDSALLSPLGGIREISANGAHSLARDAQGKVYGWGYNVYGQVGDGSFTRQTMAVQLPVFSNTTSAVSLFAGSSFSLAVDTRSRLWAWGNNGNGQCGVDPLLMYALAAPNLVAGLDNLKAVVAGVSHVVALKNDGTLWTWGYNQFGQLGDGGTIQRYTPGQIAAGKTFEEIRAFGNSSFAKEAGGKWYAWGDNAWGQLGIDTGTLPYALTPTTVSGI